ncbi:M28 family peptidase [Sphingomicrobium nitratireducens]|uniref:M28 family peptidase n=1 Tax=Sphingomicrobium nitratireducens TaxID=2964666 RepID=UPI002240862E|nr:M28 family peptidase [Sphingomicrobium nitratireducens]
MVEGRNSSIRSTVALALYLSLASCGGGGGSGGSSGGGTSAPAPSPAPAPTPSPAVAATEAALKGHITILSGDDYGGRFPGSAGETKTRQYVVSQLQSYGFEPAFGAQWVQPVPLRGWQPVSFELTIGGSDTARNDAYLYRTSAGSLQWNNRPLVAIDTAADIPANMSGQVALIEGVENFSALYQTAQDRGADAVVVMFTSASAFAQIEYVLGRGRFELDDGTPPAFETVAIVGPDTTNAILSALGTTLAAFRSANGVIGNGTLEAVADEVAISGSNVAGVLPGTNASAGAVVILAHHDHLGTCGRPGSADRICNGAVDNASGVAALLETAKRIAESDPLERSVYAFTTTAEEMGLIGARYFAANPPVPASTIHAALNVDTLALNPAGTPVAVVGWGVAGLDQSLQAAASAAGVTLAPGQETSLYLQRQDGWAFLEAGIPTVLPSSGFTVTSAYNAYFANRYHRPNDEVHAGFELGGAATDIPFYVALVRRWATPALFASADSAQRAQMVARLPAADGHHHRHPEF